MIDDKGYLIKANLYDGLDCDDDIIFYQNDTRQSKIVAEFTGKKRAAIDVADCTVVCVIQKSDKEIVTAYMENDFNVANRAEYVLSQNALASTGKGIITIFVYGSDNERQTFGSIKFKVLKDVNSGSVESTTEYPVLTKLISDAKVATNGAESAKNEILGISADIANAEKQRNIAETKREESESNRSKEFTGIKKEYESLKGIMLDENNAANLQNQINEANSQLETKANKEELNLKANVSYVDNNLSNKVGKNEIGWANLNTFDEDTRRILQGLSEGQINAVLGNGNVIKDNLNLEVKKEIDLASIKVYGGITSITKDNNEYVVSTTDLIIIKDYENLRTWKFNGVSNLRIGGENALVCNITDNEPSEVEIRDLVLTSYVNRHVILFGNYYGRINCKYRYDKTTKLLESEINETVVEKINYSSLKVFGGITKLTKRGLEYVVSTTDTIIVKDYLSQNTWRFNGVSNYVLPSDKSLVMDVLSNSPSTDINVKYNLVLESYDSRKLALIKNYYGKYESKYLNYENINILSKSPRNIVWFGDSISELKLLPHLVGELTGDNILDCSFAGSVMSYNYTPYQQLGFRFLSDSIINNDFSLQEASLIQLESEGKDITNKRENLDRLKTIDWNTINLVVVLYGTNDFGNHIPIGNGDTSSREFKGSIIYALNNLLTKYPHLQFKFISPIYREDIKTNQQNLKLIDYCNAIKEIVEQFNYEYIDFYHKCGLNQYTIKKYLLPDKLHQNDDGDIMLAEKLSKII